MRRSTRRTVLLLLCLSVAMLVAMSVVSSASARRTRFPPWAGKSYTGRSVVNAGRTIPSRPGAVTLKVAPNGKSLTYTFAWSCAIWSRTSSLTIPVTRYGAYKGARVYMEGNLRIGYALTGMFATSRRSHKLDDVAQGELEGFVQVIDPVDGVIDHCDTREGLAAGIKWLARQ